MTRRARAVYTVGEMIRWAVDDDRVIVVNDLGPDAHVLMGREALLWRFLTVPHGYGELAELLRQAADGTEPQVRHELRAILERWARLGILTRGTEMGDG